MATYEYDSSFEPPAPMLPLNVGVPFSASALASPDVRGFVDSGADITALPQVVTRQLRLRQTDTALLRGFDGRVKECPVFSVALTFHGGKPRVVRAAAWDRSYALLGRDTINLLKITLDGPRRILEVTF